MYLKVLLYSYYARYVECDSGEVLPKLEQIYEIAFPADIQDIKTAKTARHGINDSILCIVKFTAKPESVNRFLASFPEGFWDEPYDEGDDFRYRWTWPAPRWFRVPIRKGRDVSPRISPSPDIYIDTTDKENYIVFIRASLRSPPPPPQSAKPAPRRIRPV